MKVVARAIGVVMLTAGCLEVHVSGGGASPAPSPSPPPAPAARQATVDVDAGDPALDLDQQAAAVEAKRREAERRRTDTQRRACAESRERRNAERAAVIAHREWVKAHCKVDKNVTLMPTNGSEYDRFIVHESGRVEYREAMPPVTLKGDVQCPKDTPPELMRVARTIREANLPAQEDVSCRPFDAEAAEVADAATPY